MESQAAVVIIERGICYRYSLRVNTVGWSPGPSSQSQVNYNKLVPQVKSVSSLVRGGVGVGWWGVGVCEVGWGGVGWGIGKRVKRRNVFFLYYIERTVSLLYYIVSNEIY